MAITVLERLKLELHHKDYFKDEEYSIYLKENNLDPIDTYNKEEMQRKLLFTIIDILETLVNDIDLMRKIEDPTTQLSISECYKLLETRIQKIKDRIATLPDPDDEDGNSNIFMLFSKNRW
ncbi:hypothetical protein [Clostridium kluyveri]|uniref:Uncharacterized protein n=2 Tax=Clostridium kluyveri TaxID=1534 RepID=A5N5F7_CLOK5|nr:hypothetical protein [Clostridium kluyveri]EDK32538.1 Conserved hypothetical protein [Clostridium kluyveri DSM 555]BAH05478.1 hypothetical protein CKR_0427 [Clostridium kluyveri NBRC 12016]